MVSKQISPFLALYAFLDYLTKLVIKATATWVEYTQENVQFGDIRRQTCRRKVPSAPVVQKVNSAIHLVSHYLIHKGVGFSNTYPLVSDFSGG